MSIVVRYPGRACLLGEHCDWAGGSSLALPIPLDIRVEAEAASHGIRIQSSLHGELLEARWPTSGGLDRSGGPLRFVGAAAQLLSERGQTPEPCLLRVESTLPAGRGFSSSAAFSLAILDALARTGGTVLEAEELAELAFELENHRLGVGCGRLDPLACVAGAPVFLRWHEGRAPLQRITPGAPMEIVLGSFSKPRNAPAILSSLQAHAADSPGRHLDPRACRATRQAIRVFDTQAQAGARALIEGDGSALGVAMNRVQEAYEELLEPHLEDLVAPGLRAAVRLLRDTGALGAKFSGAGGDGSVIALFHTSAAAQEACAVLESTGIRAWRVSLDPSRVH